MEDDFIKTRFVAIADGVKIDGFYVAPSGDGPLPVIILLHGIPRAKHTSSDGSYRDIAASYAERGFLAATFNFRGTGESGGNIGLGGWTRDLAAVIGYLKDLPEADPSRIALLGFSAGGTAAIHAAAVNPSVAAAASVGSPAEYSFLEDTMSPAEWIGLFREIGLIRDPEYPASIEEWLAEFDEYKPANWVARVSPKPLLIMHGEEDELIPLEHARAIFEAAGDPKDFLVVPGGAHRLRVDRRALDMAMDWILKWRDSSGR